MNDGRALATMADLYVEMKEVLEFFGLRFHDMELVTVRFVEGGVEFSHNNQTILVRA